MTITIVETPDAVARSLAGRVASALMSRPTLVLGLPTGRTPVAAYAELRRMFTGGEVNFSEASTFNLDEFAGISASDPGSFRQFMEQHLFTGVNINPERIHFLNGGAADIEVECERYEAAIEAAGGIDLQILGIGANGHIGFNEPGDALIARTHRVTLLETTRRDSAALFGGDASRVPAVAMTMGVGTILRSTSLILAATGERKAQCVERTVNGPVTTRLPASLLQVHRQVELLIDRAAASRL